MTRIMDLIPRVLTSETVAETEMDLLERVGFSLEKTLLGLGRVFLVLAILYAVILLMKLFLHDIPNRKNKGAEKRQTYQEKRAEKERAKAIATAEKKRRKAAPAGSSDDAAIAAAIATAMMLEEDARLTAAITAAVAVYLEDEAKATGTLPTGFRVVSYRKRGGAWNRRR